jgi:hypothetical protein
MIRRCATVAFVVLVLTATAVPCECRSGPPVQRNAERYAGRAVFRAKVIQAVGRSEVRNGTKYAFQAIAVVQEEFWGLPWYWPRIVLLDGRYPCDTRLIEGQEHFVSGVKASYGVLVVSGCSRTRQLEYAGIDLRTVKSETCAAPGGTLIGRAYTNRMEPQVAPQVTILVRSGSGKTQAVVSDGTGIFELRHLAAGLYQIGVAGAEPIETVEIRTGQCSEAFMYLSSTPTAS